MNTPPILSPQEWEAVRQQLFVKDKELTPRPGRPCRRMPRMVVEKDYRFDGPSGLVGLLDCSRGAGS